MPKSLSSGAKRKSPPPLTPEARENQLISLANDVAEQQMRDGTASSQVITHYLKLGSAKARAELEILRLQKELVKAKTDAIRAQEKNEELFNNAISAMQSYRPSGDTY